MNAGRIKELTLFDFSHSLTSLKGLVFIIPYLFFWYLVFNFISPNAIQWLQSPQGLMFASWLLRDQELVLKLFIDRSANLSMYMLIAVAFTPMFMMLAAHNAYSSDASRGAFRFILTRTTRLELFLARFLSVLILVCLCSALTLAWAVFQAYLHDEDSAYRLGLLTIQTYLLLIVYSLPFIAFMAMISASTRSGLGTLLLGAFIYISLLLFGYGLSPEIEIGKYLLPGAIKSRLFDFSMESLPLSITMLASYTLVYMTAAWFIFQRRDM